ncbi:MAG TPA: extensin family protein [Alphaproteobacteria bacterium]
MSQRPFYVPAVLLALLVAACGAPRAVPPSSPAIELRPPPLACLEALERRGVAFEPAVAPAGARGCKPIDGINLRRAEASYQPQATLTCPMAVTLAEFERSVIQPAALRHFGRPVVTIHHWSAYSCRARAGRPGRLSEHAFGRAIDIAAFDIADGSRVSVKSHWRDQGPRGRFLRELAKRACESFNVVLTPDSDAAHADHFHFDIGPHRLCEK